MRVTRSTIDTYDPVFHTFFLLSPLDMHSWSRNSITSRSYKLGKKILSVTVVLCIFGVFTFMLHYSQYFCMYELLDPGTIVQRVQSCDL